MATFECLPRFIGMVRQFHDGGQARVQNDGEYSEPFLVTNWVKQSCVMAPTLLMLTDVFHDRYAGFPMKQNIDDNVFNLRSLQAKSKVQIEILDKPLYADDLAENAKTEIKCKGQWIACHKHVASLILQSAQKE